MTCDAPSRITRGETITLTYTIVASDAIEVGLGAGLYDTAGSDQSTGFGDVDQYHLASGRNRVNRPFRVPSTLPSGAYELVAEVWPANKIGADGVETLAGGHCGTVTVP